MEEFRSCTQKAKCIRTRLYQIAAAPCVFLLLYLGILWWTLPSIDDPQSLIAAQSSVITDREGVELYRLFQEQDRTYIPRSEIPLHTSNALIAIEDARFYEHGCIDMRAIVRAVFANIFRGRTQGASTLSQQLTRNALGLSRKKKITRKVKEIMLACSLERRYSKDEILEMYINWIPFGQNAYGVEQASQKYFGIGASDLNLAKSAILAALPQRPSYLSPYGRHLHTEISEGILEKIRREEITKVSQIPEDEITIGLLGKEVATGSTTLYVGGRTDQVLQNMQNLGFITEQERLTALEEIEHMSFQSSRETIRAPHFVLWVRQEVERMFAGADEGILEQGGLLIETTLDWNLQKRAESIVRTHSGNILTIYGAHNIALVAIHPQSKEILVYIGNTDFSDDQYSGKVDMVRSPRQPGSSFKPFVYARAFEEGYSPATTLYDVPTKIGDDEPQNFDGKFTGLLTIRQALGASRNIPAAKAFFLAGRESKILKLATKMGVTTPQKNRYELKEENEEFDYGWPLALGAAEVPLLEMTHGYSIFASEGHFRPLQFIRRITDKNGNILFEQEEIEGEEVLDPRIAYQMTSILSDPSVRPEGYWRTQLSIPRFQTAAKTGTSNKCLERDELEEGKKISDESKGACLLLKPNNAWLIGYTPELVTGVWVGNANGASMFEKGGGLNTASPIWRDFMISAHRHLESQKKEGDKELKKEFDPPEDIIQVQISTLSGELPTECTPVEHRRGEIFLQEHPPTKKDPNCVYLTIDKLTGLLASDSCPKDAREKRSFISVKSILPDRWPEWEEAVQEWATEQHRLWYATLDHSGALLPLPPAPREECDASLTPGRLEKPTVRITYPTNGGVASYPSFQPQIESTVGSHRENVTYFLDGKKVQSIQGTGAVINPPLRVPKSINKGGNHTLKIELEDAYFNKAVHEVRFRFEQDVNPPKIRLISPRGDITLSRGAELKLKADASDSEGGIKYVQFFIDDTLLTTKPKEPYELTYELNLDPGVYQIHAKATDLAGNEAETNVKLTIITPSKQRDGISGPILIQ